MPVIENNAGMENSLGLNSGGFNFLPGHFSVFGPQLSHL